MNIIISNEQAAAAINPRGAELASFKVNEQEYIWEGNPDFWGKHSPILFPIVGTLRNNTYKHNDKDYVLPRHGFARDNEFVVKHQDISSVTFSLTATAETLKIYPFDFELDLKYTLKDNTLLLEYTISNNGDDAMPFSLGAHPAFALPGLFSTYSLHFEQSEALVSSQLENDLISLKTVLLPTQNNVLPLTYSLFENDALIFKSLSSNYIDILESGSPLLRVAFDNFPHMGIWTKQSAPFICIEPWQGYSDAADASGILSEKEGVIVLPPGEKFNAQLSIEILR